MDVFAMIRYIKRKQIGVGQGLNSTVFLADDPHLNREIAVKEVDKANVHGGGWDAYHREARVMFDSRHDNVVPIHYACVTPTEVCLAMPYFQKGSLQGRITSGPPPLKEAYRTAHGILSAVSQVHVANVLHFDLKPSNVLFSDTGEPMIADFGQARLMDPTGVAAVPALYKYGVPPEAFGGVGTVESDVYQAGLTLYRLFNGDPFFKDQIPRLRQPLRQSIVRGRLPNRRKFLPHLPGGIRRVIRKALRVDPGDRYHSATQMQDALSRVGLPLNWETELRPKGEIGWVAKRDGSPDLEVDLLRDSGRRWKVEVHTSWGGKKRRRKGVDELWTSNLTGAEADRRLNWVFQELA